MRYILKYKKRFFWRTVKNAKGHKLDMELDRMDIFLDNGIVSISNWSKCDMKLGADFLLFQKNEMENEAGQSIKVDGV